MNTYLAILLVMIGLFLLTTLTALYIRKYDNPNLTIAFYVALIAVVQIITTRITIFDFGFFQLVSPIGTYFFAFTFQMTDQINEKYGRKEVQKMIVIALVTQVFIFFMLWLATQQPQINIDDFSAESYNAILLGSTRIIIASWITFFISENVDAYVFEWFKKKYDGKLWLRNIVSDLTGLFIDSIIFIPLAFYGTLPLEVLISITFGQVITKWIFGTLDTPFIYLNRWLLNTDNSLIKKLAN